MAAAAVTAAAAVNKPGGNGGSEGDDGCWRQGNHDGRWRQESGVEQVSKPGKGEGGRVEKVTTAIGVREGE